MLELTGFTLDLIGKVLVSYTAISVHYRFFKEHKVDKAVFQEMKKERLVGIIGITLMILGYIFHSAHILLI